jgi:hypothetical protein
MSFIPPIIQRDPLGLLGVLDLKSGGQRPQQLAEFVQPVLEMLPLYLASQARYGSGNTAANTALGAIIPLTVANPGASPPSGKLWFITTLAASRLITATSWLSFAAIVRPNTSVGLDLYLTGPAQGSFTATNQSNTQPHNDMLVARFQGLQVLRDEGDIAIKNGLGNSAVVNDPVYLTWSYVEVDV